MWWTAWDTYWFWLLWLQRAAMQLDVIALVSYFCTVNTLLPVFNCVMNIKYSDWVASEWLGFDCLRWQRQSLSRCVRSGFCADAAVLSSPSLIDTNKIGAIFMEAIPLCLSLNKTHLFSITLHRFILAQTVPLHACYMSRPEFRPSLGMSIHNSYKEDIKPTKILQRTI